MKLEKINALESRVQSPSSQRVWIEIKLIDVKSIVTLVTLFTEGVD